MFYALRLVYLGIGYCSIAVSLGVTHWDSHLGQTVIIVDMNTVVKPQKPTPVERPL